MPHQAETPSPAITHPAPAFARRKCVILLCSEDLRFVACGVEEALRQRGWNVRVEFGEDARPWVQKAPVERPSVRILCVPGTVDRELAAKLRTAFAPEPDADLHILGIDDSHGLVQEIERLAGVRTLARRSLHRSPRLAHTTLVEQQVQTDRSWRLGAAAAIAAFMVTVGGGALLDQAGDAPTVSAARPAASFTSVLTPADDQPVARETFDDPVLSAVGPASSRSPTERWELDALPEDEDEIIIFDDEVDEPAPTRRRLAPAEPAATSIGAPPLSEPTAIQRLAQAPALADAAPVTIAATTHELPPGFLPVGNLAVAPPALPPGFLPVAGLAVTSGADPVDLDGLPTVITYDPFVPRHAGVPEAESTSLHDPFGSMSGVTAP